MWYFCGRRNINSSISGPITTTVSNTFQTHPSITKSLNRSGSALIPHLDNIEVTIAEMIITPRYTADQSFMISRTVLFSHIIGYLQKFTNDQSTDLISWDLQN